VKKYIAIYKESGFKGLVQKVGWPAAIAVFMFFLVKGLLWLIIPYLAAKGFLKF
jgi:hypothetical protein